MTSPSSPREPSRPSEDLLAVVVADSNAHGVRFGEQAVRAHVFHRQRRSRGVGGKLTGRGVAFLDRLQLGAGDRQFEAGVWLKVDKASPQAIGFYRKHGFRIAGTSYFAESGQPREHWVMHRVLDAHGKRPMRGTPGRA